MFGPGVVLLVVFGCLWLCGALIGGLFKLTFGLFGALCSGLFGLFAAGLVLLLVLPIVLFALLPLLMPVLLIAVLVGLVVHASHAHVPPAAPDGTAR